MNKIYVNKPYKSVKQNLRDQLKCLLEAFKNTNAAYLMQNKKCNAAKYLPVYFICIKINQTLVKKSHRE